MLPKCEGCIFGTMTKVPQRTKAVTNKHMFITFAPSKCISVNRLLLRQVGFIAQLKGTPTTQRFTATTVFVNLFSHVWYVYLMQNLSLDKTIEAKQVFKQFASHHCVIIRHYHCDNSRFAEHSFTKGISPSPTVVSTLLSRME